MPAALTYTLLSLALAILLLSFWVGSKRQSKRFPKLAQFSTSMTLAAIALAYLTVRPGAGDDGQSAIVQAAAADRPLFVDVYSNF